MGNSARNRRAKVVFPVRPGPRMRIGLDMWISLFIFLATARFPDVADEDEAGRDKESGGFNEAN